MSTCLHEVHIDINIHCLSFLALLAIDYAGVFVPAQVMHKFVLPFVVLIIWIVKLISNFLLSNHFHQIFTTRWKHLNKFACDFSCHRLLIKKSTKWYHRLLLPVCELAAYLRHDLFKWWIDWLIVCVCSVVVNVGLIVLQLVLNCEFFSPQDHSHNLVVAHPTLSTRLFGQHLPLARARNPKFLA